MPDIQLRFHHDVLVLSAPPALALRRIGLEGVREQQLALLLEPETVEDAYQLEVSAGPQALCALTDHLAPIQLAKAGMDGQGEALASAALSIVQGFRPQHVIAPVSPCGLPLDPWSAASLKENRAQYAQVAKLLKEQEIDSILLDSFESLADLKCALMGIRMVTSAPIIACAKVDAEGRLADGRARLAEALEVMSDLQASVVGFATAAEPQAAVAMARAAVEVCDLPLLVQLDVGRRDFSQLKPTAENPYYCPDTFVDAALQLQQVGVQFLRAGGDATPAYTGALAASVANMAVTGRAVVESAEEEPELEHLLSPQENGEDQGADALEAVLLERLGAVDALPSAAADAEVFLADDVAAGEGAVAGESPADGENAGAGRDFFQEMIAEGRANIDAALGKRTSASPDIVVEDSENESRLEALCGDYACLVEPPTANEEEAQPATADHGKAAPQDFVIAAVAEGESHGVAVENAADVAAPSQLED